LKGKAAVALTPQDFLKTFNEGAPAYIDPPNIVLDGSRRLIERVQAKQRSEFLIVECVKAEHVISSQSVRERECQKLSGCLVLNFVDGRSKDSEAKLLSSVEQITVSLVTV